MKWQLVLLPMGQATTEREREREREGGREGGEEGGRERGREGGRETVCVHMHTCTHIIMLTCTRTHTQYIMCYCANDVMSLIMHSIRVDTPS